VNPVELKLVTSISPPDMSKRGGAHNFFIDICMKEAGFPKPLSR
jgi:hypothetical protein